MSKLVIISHENDEIMATDYFLEQLEKRWPSVQTRPILDQGSPFLAFEIAKDFTLGGEFSGEGISYKGYDRTHDAEFALWYRSIAPLDWKLRVYDSDLTFNVMSLTNESTKEQILAGFNVPFDGNKY